VNLSISSREGVEIDFCPQCRGVWLDRGELDKVIERASASLGPAPAAASAGYGEPRDRYRDDDRRRYDRDDDHRRYDRDDDRRRYDSDDQRRRDPRAKKKRSFLDDIFDFD
jgi:Zn-finger nucleic acid-binding protein